MDIKKINDIIKSLLEQVDILSYNLNVIKQMKGLEKNTNLKSSIFASEAMRNILNEQSMELSRELRAKLNEDIDNKYMMQLIKMGFLKDDAIKRMGKILGIKNAIIDGAIRTANETRRIKVAQDEKVRQSKKS